MRLHNYLSMLAVLATAACGSDDAFKDGDYGNNVEPPAMEGMTAAHNAVRLHVSPAPASPLVPLEWSSAIAEVAKEYAEHCVFEHSGDNRLGENLYVESGRSSGPAEVVEAWASEDEFYSYATNGCASGEQCGHYTQIVWSDTRRVGCGRAQCSAASSPFGNGQPWVNWVCNYDPPGNYVGQRPY